MTSFGALVDWGFEIFGVVASGPIARSEFLF